MPPQQELFNAQHVLLIQELVHQQPFQLVIMVFMLKLQQHVLHALLLEHVQLLA